MQYLRDELSRIDESWAAARFDSLPHVVHILTSKDRESEVQFLKEQSDIIEEVVDEVVHAYHSGFNKAIQNYSQVSNQFSPWLLYMLFWMVFYILHACDCVFCGAVTDHMMDSCDEQIDHAGALWYFT